MLRIRLILFLVVVALGGLAAQTTILDFEQPATTTTFQYFGSAIDGQLSTTVANPNPDAVNNSSTVLEFRKPANSQTWAGAFSKPNPATPVDVTAGGKVTVMVHLDHIGNLALKLENPLGGGAAWLQTRSNTVVNGWEKLVFDVAVPSEEAPNQPASGKVYQTVTLFVDFGSNSPSDQTAYIDNIVVEPVITCTTILDFEAPATSTTFQYFGSTLDPQLSQVVANPNPTGINTSDSVLWFRKPANSQTWAGAFSNPKPATPVNLTGNSTIRIKVHTDHPGNLALKLEGSSTGAANWVITQDITTVNQWVELNFDPKLPSIEAPNQPASGQIYTVVTLFFDFGTAFQTEQSYYLDEIRVCSSGATPKSNVTFKLDMNQYAGPYTNVYVSGSFNDWSGDANPLTDPDGDKIYTATLDLPVGLYEYKFTLDNWNAAEDLPITSACTKTTFDGPNVFTNRKLALASDTTVVGPVCFNSCYACGAGVQITYNLGMNNYTPDTGGVYLAGGPEFGPPNPRFQMHDTDGDGVFTISIERERGFGGYYDFTNGVCPDFTCKEDLTGQPCARPENYNDRWLDPVQQDTVVNTCFASCATNTDCTSAAFEAPGKSSWFDLRPTLATDDVQLMLQPTATGKTLVRVFNATGMPVWTGTATDSIRIPAAGWAPGLYFLVAEQGERRCAARFVKL